MNTPLAGQRLLPEWAPQDGVLLTWPHSHSDWRDLLEDVEPVFMEIAYQVSRRERVLINCHDQACRDHVATMLDARGIDRARVSLPIVPSNDAWARDHGPITVLRSGRPMLLDFQFNGWGNKYPAELDDRITATLHESGLFGATERQPVDLVLEGGGIECDGQGTLLTTTSCLLNPNRNPELDRARLQARLGELFGVQRILWLSHGQLTGDDTDGHIDTLARFCDPATIAYAACDDPADEHFGPLNQMEQELRELRTTDDQPYRLVALPIPRAIHDPGGARLPATYANFLIINGAVLVPTYDDPADRIALQRLQPCFPDRDLVAINCLPLIQQFGSLHCVTMQLPAGVLASA